MQTFRCRYCVIALGSDASGRTVLDKLKTKSLHGQAPIVMPCNRHNLSRFEDQTRKDTPQQNGQGDRGMFLSCFQNCTMHCC